MISKREIKKAIVEKKKITPRVEPHHSGKGTKERINTIAEKMLFNSHISD